MFIPKGILAAAAVAAVALAGGVARANDVPNRPGQPGNDKMGVGIGVICNTTEQAQDYVKLRGDGAEITLAVNAVNESAQDPRACGIAAVAFERDKTMETRSVQGRLVSIVRVRVLAGFDGQKWSRVPAMTQYAIMENEGVEV